MRSSKDRLPSRHTTEGPGSAFHRVFYYAMGLSKAEIDQPHVGVVTAWDDSREMHDEVRQLALHAKTELASAALTPREFTTIPGFDQGHGDGSPASTLVPRELIADSCELTVRGHSYDALLGLAASTLGLAGLAMAACRLAVPAAVIPHVHRDDHDGIATAGALVALGLAEGPLVPQGVPGSSLRRSASVAVGGLVQHLSVRQGARHGVTIANLRRAAAIVGVTAESIDPLLHLRAIAHECGVTVSIDELVDASARAAADEDEARADVLSTALSGVGPRSRRHIALLRGPLAPAGAIAVAPAGVTKARAPAVVGSSEEVVRARVGDMPSEGPLAAVVTHQGPRGGPGMPRCDRIVDEVARPAQRQLSVVVTDGRARSHPEVVVVAAVTPEAVAGGPIAAIRDGDTVVVDMVNGTLDLLKEPDAVPSAGADAGAGGWEPPPVSRSITWWKYAQVVGPATEGAVTQPGASAETLRYFDT